MSSGHKNIDRGQDMEDDSKWTRLRCPRCGRTTQGRLGKTLCAFRHPPVVLKEDAR